MPLFAAGARGAGASSAREVLVVPPTAGGGRPGTARPHLGFEPGGFRLGRCVTYRRQDVEPLADRTSASPVPVPTTRSEGPFRPDDRLKD